MKSSATIASSASAPVLKRSKSSSRLPTSGSVGSIESRLSSSHSQRRLRTITVTGAQLYRKTDTAPEVVERPDTPTGKRHLLPVFFTHKSSELESPSRPRPLPSPLLRWLFVLYSAWCCLYTSASCFFGEYGQQAHHSLRHKTLNELGNSQWLSRISPHQPPLVSLRPNVLEAQHAPSNAITACLWTPASDVMTDVHRWISVWPGPISAVITTDLAPGSSAHASLVRRLRASSSTRQSRLSLHLLHTSSGPPTSPNAYLNLARLFAPTETVVLFPGNITLSPAHIALLQDRIEDRPFVLTSRAPSTFPPFPAAPVALPRDYPVWCSERFFFVDDRLADWKECIWHIWLNQLGDVGFMNMTSVNPIIGGMSSADRKIRSRLVTRFRTETCDHFAKQLVTREDEGVRTDRTKQRWLIDFCRKVSSLVLNP
ncbi:hypothetical protein BD626DRAFT_544114 [Schizophyllum amplum]|uniref:Glycosyltransferase family 49 protein n=1 Tax=Schizophyllum amplum TaxID=97359 RepID=A0A550CX15_9AGAR|nr:hypothetical protein BD626DRAFT_544114 [Auriculariopsis ampla]